MNTLDDFRKGKDRFFQTSAQSPLTPEQKKAFHGLSYFPENPALRFELPLDKYAKPDAVRLQTSTGDTQDYTRAGQIHFPVGDQTVTLQVYQPVHGHDFFVPFVDATAPAETYGAGRYLDPEALDGGNLLVDFNLAYNPYCAYNEPHSLSVRAGREPRTWSCPIPPLENRLKVAIRAGEMKPVGDWVEQEHE